MTSWKKEKRIRLKRKRRVRGKIRGTSDRPRLSVFRSTRHIYVQAIDDDGGRTLAAVSTISKGVEEISASVKKTDAAARVGKRIAHCLKDLGIERVIFDRGRFLYHGRIKVLAEAAREEGLKF